MLGWFRRRASQPLSGAPSVRREKNYTAGSGYVYHYFYLGHRPSGRGTEYVFEVSADRRQFTLVSVVVDGAASTERYAIAKMSLFRSFDRYPRPAGLPREIRVSPADAAEVLKELGID